MYWPSSNKTAGYEKGKYSHALPAGVLVLSLFSLTIGLIVSTQFPRILLEWTKNHMCIMGPWQNEFSDWVNDSYRRVTITVGLWNITNLQQFLHNAQIPNFSLVGPFVFDEFDDGKKNVAFSNGEVTFKKSILLSQNCNFLNSKCHSPTQQQLFDNDSQLRLFDVSIFKKFNDDLTVLLYLRNLSQSLLSSIEISNYSTSDKKMFLKFWLISTFNGSCRSSDTNDISLVDINWLPKICRLLQLPFDNVSVDKKPFLIKLTSSILDQIFSIFDDNLLDRNESLFTIRTGQTCEQSCRKIQSNQLSVLITYHMCKYNHVEYIMTSCLININDVMSTFGNGTIEQKQNLDLLERTIFTTLKIFILFINQNNTIKNLDFLFFNEDILSNGEKKGFFDAAIGSGSKYKLKLCIDKWDLDSSTIFQWNDFQDNKFQNNIYSEYGLPPAGRISPCTSPPPVKLYYILFDGIWNPIPFLYKNTTKLYSDSLHVYESADIRFYDNGFVDASSGYNMPIFLTRLCDAQHSLIQKSNICLSNKHQNLQFYVEPVTGSIWHFDLTYQINAKIPDELLVLYNISVSNLSNRFVPLGWIRRQSRVTPFGQEYYRATVKPFMTVTCGCSILFHIIAIMFMTLAIYLMVKLHWIPLKEIRFSENLSDVNLQQLNTIKLRKLLGQ